MKNLQTVPSYFVDRLFTSFITIFAGPITCYKQTTQVADTQPMLPIHYFNTENYKLTALYYK